MAINRACFAWCGLDPTHEGECRRMDDRPLLTMHCDQCKVSCSACAIGAVHFNMDPPYPGYRPGDETIVVDWPSHNSHGHHHGLWNGHTNEMVACGSARADQLVEFKHCQHEFALKTSIGSDDPHDQVDAGLAERLAKRTLDSYANQSSVGRLEQELADNAIDPREKMSELNTRQVGGDHYGGSAIQHWDLVVMFEWDFFQGQIIKYVMRWRKKGGLQDLKKALHNLQKYIEEIEAGRIEQ